MRRIPALAALAAAFLPTVAPTLAAPRPRNTIAVASAASLGPLLAAGTWLNGHPSAERLHGKVVLVDVFTFDCINCKNVTPNLRTLARTRPGLEIIGIHSPETPYEREHDEVVRHLALLGVTWPVAIDNDFALWRSYGIESWPTQMLFDRGGRLRSVFIGDSQDAAVDRAVDALLRT